jgi:hypothetical protein
LLLLSLSLSLSPFWDEDDKEDLKRYRITKIKGLRVGCLLYVVIQAAFRVARVSDDKEELEAKRMALRQVFS